MSSAVPYRLDLGHLVDLRIETKAQVSQHALVFMDRGQGAAQICLGE